jgi:hypothetical protein
MEAVTFGTGRKALRSGDQKLNLHPADRALDKNVRHATPRCGHGASARHPGRASRARSTSS